MSSFVFEIWLFNPTLTMSLFSKDDKTAVFVAFLNGFWFRKPNNNQPAHQLIFGRFCLWGITFIFKAKKQPNQQ